MIINDSAASQWWRRSVGQNGYRGYGYGDVLPGAISSCSTTSDCPAGYACNQNQCVPVNITGVIARTVPTTGIYTATGPAGPSGVASDADIAAANRKKNMMIAGGVGAALLVGWLVFGKKRRGRR